ncbi:IclR family transcriptional regulator [Nocardioides deserti]|uniref:IclR family transcriptional regulator n=1 Tax=Nocardioides deserti TaxID=1588644 RepID=A0ABR6UBE0_9ACTN|nr:IclR family transcriptional regulator [Nocardioides deserti]
MEATAPAPRGSRTLEGLERALDVLLLFTEPNAASLGVSEISRSLDLPKAVVHRILTTLCSRDFLELNESTRRYTLGPSWLVMGSTYAQRVDVRDLARDALVRLSAQTSETSTLSIRHGNHRVYLDQVTPRREVIMSVEVGARFPLHAGSSSKAFLAFLPPEDQEDYLHSVDLVALTDQTVIDRRLLAEELAAVRERGYSVSFGERQQGAGAIAAPLLDFENRPAAVVSVCGPAARIQGNVEALAAALLAETRELSARLGHRPLQAG